MTTGTSASEMPRRLISHSAWRHSRNSRVGLQLSPKGAAGTGLHDCMSLPSRLSRNVQLKLLLAVHIIICTLESCFLNGTRTRLRQVFESAGCSSRKRPAYSTATMQSRFATMKAIRMSSGLRHSARESKGACYSGENIRIVSARTAGRSERQQYEAQR